MYKRQGQSVTAEERSVDGFTLDTSITGTVTEGTTNIQNVLSLKLYYTRNTHNVTYQYEGSVPADAPAVPGEAARKYQAQVAVAENPNVTGYVFSGWTAATEEGTAVTTTGGKFVMPDANVVLKGSFTAAEQTYNCLLYTSSVRPSKTKMWYHRTAWILPTVPRKSLKHCSLETERYMKSIRTSRETAWRQSYGYL